MKHSPGPFRAGTMRGSGVEILDANRCVIAMVREPVAHVHLVSDAWQAQDANVALFMAAPDLLAAAKKALDSMLNAGALTFREYKETKKALREAIAKAEGGAA